jgi:hypothetical protein
MLIHSCNAFASILLLLPGKSDSDCSSQSANSSCVVSKCRQHSAFLADALSPAVQCQYQRGSCVYRVEKSKSIVWPVRNLCDPILHTNPSFALQNIHAFIRSFADCLGFRFGPKATGHRYLDCQCSSSKMGIQNYGCDAYYPCFMLHAFSCMRSSQCLLEQVFFSGAALTLATFALAEYFDKVFSRLKQR